MGLDLIQVGEHTGTVGVILPDDVEPILHDKQGHVDHQFFDLFLPAVIDFSRFSQGVFNLALKLLEIGFDGLALFLGQLLELLRRHRFVFEQGNGLITRCRTVDHQILFLGHLIEPIEVLLPPGPMTVLDLGQFFLVGFAVEFPRQPNL